jgi:hypothetical protein
VCAIKKTPVDSSLSNVVVVVEGEEEEEERSKDQKVVINE